MENPSTFIRNSIVQTTNPYRLPMETTNEAMYEREVGDKARTVKPMYVFVDSRDRDVTHYPNPASFKLSLGCPIFRIHRITLMSAYIPAIAGADTGERYVIVSEKHCRNAIKQPEFASDFPFGAVAMIPLVDNNDNGDNGVWWEAKSSAFTWSCFFPQALPQLDSIDITVSVYNYIGAAATQYGLADEALPNYEDGARLDPLNNIVLGFKIEHEFA